MNYYMPVRLFTGADCIADHKDEFLRFGKRALIVTGHSSAKKCGALDTVSDVFSELGISYELFDDVRSNPTVTGCMEVGSLASGFHAEFILGIGGGSVLDTAKAAAVFAANPELDESDFYAKKWKNRPLPVALVGTTAGTGSEVTDVSVLMDSKHLKHSIHDPLLFSSVSFGDPKYTLSLPRSVTLSTGVDVLAHCAESYFSRKANPISRAYAVRGISLLVSPLSAAVDGVELSYEQREQLYEASILGGLAISVTGTCFPHNIGYYLTENYGVPHGIACAAFFEDLISHAEKCDPKLADTFFRETGTEKPEMLSLVNKILAETEIRIDINKLCSVVSKWENNGSVKNTIGTVMPDDIVRFYSKYALN